MKAHYRRLRITITAQEKSAINAQLQLSRPVEGGSGALLQQGHQMMYALVPTTTSAAMTTCRTIGARTSRLSSNRATPSAGRPSLLGSIATAIWIPTEELSDEAVPSRTLHSVFEESSGAYRAPFGRGPLPGPPIEGVRR